MPELGSRAGLAVLGATLLVGIVLRASELLSADLWLDEYHSLLIAATPTLRGVLAFTSAEPQPPAYILLVHVLMRLLGGDPLVVRGFSFALGVATLAGATVAAARRWGWGGATVAAAVLGGSTIAIHFSTVIRPYSLAAFAVLVSLIATTWAVDRPSPRSYLAATAALSAALAVNFFAITLLPVGPALAALRGRWRVSVHQLLVALFAFVLTVPPLVRVATEVPPEANEYLQTLFEGQGLSGVLAGVVRDLLPSGRWPSSYGPGAVRGSLDTALEAVSLAGVLLALAGGVAAARRRSVPEGFPTLEAGCALLLGSALSLAALSFLLGRPVSIPGRFAFVFLPEAALLVGAATTWGRAGRTGAALLVGVVVASTGVRLARTEAGVRVSPDRLVAALIEARAPGPIYVVAVGLTGTPMRYLLRGHPGLAVVSFPTEVGRHSGWWAPRKALSEPFRLARDAGAAAGRAAEAARRGERVFVVGADHPVAAPLRAALDRFFLARALHPLARGAFELTLRPPAAGAGPPGPTPEAPR